MGHIDRVAVFTSKLESDVLIIACVGSRGGQHTFAPEFVRRLQVTLLGERWPERGHVVPCPTLVDERHEPRWRPVPEENGFALYVQPIPGMHVQPVGEDSRVQNVRLVELSYDTGRKRFPNLHFRPGLGRFWPAALTA